MCLSKGSIKSSEIGGFKVLNIILVYKSLNNLYTWSRSFLWGMDKLFQSVLLYCFPFFLVYFFNWKKIALQCCVGFFHTIIIISHNYTYTPSSCASPPPPIPPLQVITEPEAELHVLYSNFSPIYFTHESTYMSMLPSSFVSLSPSPAVSTSPFSTSVSPFLPCKQVQYQFSRLHIYALICEICFCFLTSLCITGLGSSTSLLLTQISSLLGLINIPLYISTTSSLSIHLQMDFEIASMSWLP